MRKKRSLGAVIGEHFADHRTPEAIILGEVDNEIVSTASQKEKKRKRTVLYKIKFKSF